MVQISYQLYSSRSFGPVDQTLAMLAATGFGAVEGYPGLYTTPDQASHLRAALDASGLTMPSGHFSLDMLRDTPGTAIEIAQRLGVTHVVAPYLEASQRPVDAAGWAALGHTLGQIGAPLRDAGLTFGWHNHDFEVADLGGADRPLDLILAGHEDTLLELDIAWVVRGGDDPLRWIARHGDRIRAVHIKDIAAYGTATDEDGWADPGHGTLDWPSLLGALKDTPCTLLVAEHDNPSDHVRFARRALSYLEASA